MAIARSELKACFAKEAKRIKNVHFPGCGEPSDEEREVILVEVAQKRIEKAHSEVEVAENAAMALQDFDVNLKDDRAESNPPAQEENHQDSEEEDVFGWGFGVEEVGGEVSETFISSLSLKPSLTKIPKAKWGSLGRKTRTKQGGKPLY